MTKDKFNTLQWTAIMFQFMCLILGIYTKGNLAFFFGNLLFMLFSFFFAWRGE
jgi:hypothetical protein